MFFLICTFVLCTCYCFHSLYPIRQGLERRDSWGILFWFGFWFIYFGLFFLVLVLYISPLPGYYPRDGCQNSGRAIGGTEFGLYFWLSDIIFGYCIFESWVFILSIPSWIWTWVGTGILLYLFYYAGRLSWIFPFCLFVLGYLYFCIMHYYNIYCQSGQSYFIFIIHRRYHYSKHS